MAILDNRLLLLLALYSFSCLFIMAAGPSAIKVLQWNCRSQRTTFHFLRQYLAEKRGYDFLCLQSLNCVHRDLPQLEGYFYPPFCKVAPNKRVAVATYVRSPISCSAVSFPTPDAVHSICVEVYREGGGKLSILNVYAPEGEKEGLWLENPDLDQNDWLVVGDLNAHSSLWEHDCPTYVHNSILTNRILDSPLTLLNDGTPTRIPTGLAIGSRLLT